MICSCLCYSSCVICSCLCYSSCVICSCLCCSSCVICSCYCFIVAVCVFVLVLFSIGTMFSYSEIQFMKDIIHLMVPLFVSRENRCHRLPVLLRAGRELLDVRPHRVPAALPRGRARQHDNRTEDEGENDLRGQQRVSL